MVVTASPEMLLTILILLILGILVIVVWLVNYIAGPSVKKKSKGKRPSVQFALEPSEEPSPTAGDAKERRSLPMGEREIMRVLRDEDTGAIIVEVEGNRYRRLTEIRDGRIGNQVLEAIADLIKFTGGIVRGQWAAASVTPVVPTRERPPQPQVVEPASPPRAVAVEPPVSDEEEAFLQRLREGDLQVSKTPPEEAQPSIRGYFTRRRRPQAAAEPAGAGGTFIDEIEAILQRMISTAPTLLGKEVHIRTGPDGGLQIQVGVRYFSSADEVPDPAIRDLIKAAVKEWERS